MRESSTIVTNQDDDSAPEPRESTVRHPDEAPPPSRQRRPARAPCSRREAAHRQGADSHARLRPCGLREDHASRPVGDRQTYRTPFAWVSLDAMDADPARLWSHVLTALQEVHDSAGQRSFAGVRRRTPRDRRDSAPAADRGAHRLPSDGPRTRGLAHRGQPCRATRRSARSWISPRAPSKSSSRAATTRLPIARLRAHGDLLELRARDLSISPDRGRALFREADVRSRAVTSGGSPSGPRAGSRGSV